MLIYPPGKSAWKAGICQADKTVKQILSQFNN